MKRGILVLAVLVLLVGGCTRIVPAPAADERYWGTWVSEDPNTLGITRVEIEPWAVRMWGACEPEDCEWGETTYAIHEVELHVVWDHGYAIRVQVLAIQPGGSLRIETTTYFTDGTGTRTDVDTLLRQIDVLL